MISVLGVVAIAATWTTLDAGEGTPLPVVVAMQIDDQTSRLLEEEVARRTNLIVETLPTSTIDGCAGGILCIAKAINTASQARDSRLALVISGGASRVSALVIDLAGALGCFETAPEAGEDAEACAERAILASALGVEVADTDALRAHLSSLASGPFRSALEGASSGPPLGALEVTIDRTGCTLALDDRPLGIVDGNTARIERVRPGPRTLHVSHPDGPPTSVDVNVQSRVTVKTSVSIPFETHPIRTAATIAGAVMAAAGLVLTVWAIVSTRPSPSFCSNPNDCGTFSTTGQLASSSIAGAPPPGGPLAAPLGYSMTGAGVAFGLGGLWIGDANVPPWIAIAAGVAVGVLGYGLSALAN